MLIKIEQNYPRIKELEEGIVSLGDAIKIDTLCDEVTDLDTQTASQDFWTDAENSQRVLKLLKAKKALMDDYLSVRKKFDDLLTYIEMINSEGDESYADEALAELAEVEKQFSAEKISVMLSGEYDASNTILSIHPGAGGTEAQDWAEMLYRMYCRFAER
ncbi:MAG: PCRF domain-containing protein, partial [Clostridia bacterium]